MNQMKIVQYLYIASFVFLFGCTTRSEKAAEADQHDDEHTADKGTVELTSAQMEAAQLKIGKIENKQISGTIRVSGVLDVPPQQLVSISVPLGGFLKDTKLLEGSRVKKGQVIATIENLEFIQIQQDFLEAKGQFEVAKADYDRQQELAKENVNSQKVLHQSKATYLSWKARYKALSEKMRVLNLDPVAIENGDIQSTIRLYSPIDGYVTQVNVNIGKFVNPADVLFEIVDTEHLHAELIVFEKDVPKLKIGQRVRFTLANETKERLATVYLIGREITKERTVQIHCHIDEEDTELLPGMYLTAIVESGGNIVPALPSHAISDFQGENFIFIHSATKQDGTGVFQMIPIKTLNSENGFTEVEVADSLRNADIVIEGGYTLLSKVKNSGEEEHDH